LKNKVLPIYAEQAEEQPEAMDLNHPTVDHLLVGYSSRALGEGATADAIADLSNRIARQHEQARRDLGDIEPGDVERLADELEYFSI
jgi:hypothetical protein